MALIGNSFCIGAPLSQGQVGIMVAAQRRMNVTMHVESVSEW